MQNPFLYIIYQQPSACIYRCSCSLFFMSGIGPPAGCTIDYEVYMLPSQVFNFFVIIITPKNVFIFTILGCQDQYISVKRQNTHDYDLDDQQTCVFLSYYLISAYFKKSISTKSSLFFIKTTTR